MPLLLLAYLGFIGLGLPDGMLGVAWPQMQTEFHEPVGAVGFVLFATVVGYVASSVAAGFAVSRLGVGWLLAASMALTATSMAGVALAPALPVVVAASLVLGLGSGAIDTGLNSYVARHFGARHISWLHASYGVGAATGPLVVTGALAAGLAWRWGYGAVALALALLGLGFALTAPTWVNRSPVRASAASAAAAHAGREPAPAPPGRQTLALPALWYGAGGFVLQVAIEVGTGLWAYTLLTEGRGMPGSPAGVAVSAYWASMLAGRLLSGAVTDRVGTHQVLTGGVAGMVAGAVLVSLPAPGWLTVAGLMVIGFGAAPMFPLLTLTTAERVGDAHADRTIGVQIGGAGVGAVAGPAAIGVLIGRVGPEVLGPCLVVLAVALALLYGRWRRR